MLVVEGEIGRTPIVACRAGLFSFMGGSMGMYVGNAIIAAATTRGGRQTPADPVFRRWRCPHARGHSGSLMQMPRTTVAVEMLKEAGLPYIVVLTHPTTGGVTASYAMLGDVHIAEPNALICFAGPRVIEQTIREKLPEGFQRAEYLLDHGMLDRVTHQTQEHAGRTDHHHAHVDGAAARPSQATCPRPIMVADGRHAPNRGRRPKMDTPKS